MQRKELCGVPRRGVDAVFSGGARRDVFGVRGSRIDSFSVWFLGASFMSLIAHTDLATNSLFLSTVLATKQCEEMNHIEDAWEAVFSKTVSRFVAEPPRFLFVVCVFWFLLFGQFFHGVVSSVLTATDGDEPKNLGGVRQLLGLEDGDLYEVKDRHQGGRAFGFKTYPTMLHPNAWSLQRELAQLHLYKSGHLFKEVLRTLAFFLVFMWFESIVQLELQGSALELGKALSQKLDKEMALSLLLTPSFSDDGNLQPLHCVWEVWGPDACLHGCRCGRPQRGVPEIRQDGQDLLQNSPCTLRLAGRGVRLVVGARNDEKIYGFLLPAIVVGTSG